PLTRPLFDSVVENDNPANALKESGSLGQVFSDVSGENQIATVQVRDLTTNIPRKSAMRMVYVCASRGVES
ncbi:MAG: hypothetical protein KAI17_24145, partial [Thiotrichaceae bacterium]|nr:hypothetical protein [Thiotrichaceae bacterium]